MLSTIVKKIERFVSGELSQWNYTLFKSFDYIQYEDYVVENSGQIKLGFLILTYVLAFDSKYQYHGEYFSK